MLKAVALGARAVLVGGRASGAWRSAARPACEAVLRNLLADTDLTLAMAGLSSLGQVDRDLLVPRA